MIMNFLTEIFNRVMKFPSNLYRTYKGFFVDYVQNDMQGCKALVKGLLMYYALKNIISDLIILFNEIKF